METMKTNTYNRDTINSYITFDSLSCFEINTTKRIIIRKKLYANTYCITIIFISFA
jgi:hypothetical protein